MRRRIAKYAPFWNTLNRLIGVLGGFILAYIRKFLILVGVCLSINTPTFQKTAYFPKIPTVGYCVTVSAELINAPIAHLPKPEEPPPSPPYFRPVKGRWSPYEVYNSSRWVFLKLCADVSFAIRPCSFSQFAILDCVKSEELNNRCD